MNFHTAPIPRPRLSWLAGLVTTLAALAAQAEPASQPDACLQARLATQPGFSGVALLRQAGRTWVATQGHADAAGTQPLEADSRFNLGSASKMFTAVAVAQLVERQRLALDAPIGRWVDGLTPEVAAVTLRQLLTHSGGLGNFFTPDHLQAMQDARTLDDLRPLAQDERPAFPPGSRFDYSNNGFLLLGIAVERASGQALGDYLQQHVFTPAGMDSTSLLAELPRRAAQGFTRMPVLGVAPPPRARVDAPPPGGNPPPPSGPLRPSAEAQLRGSSAGGAFSTARDLLRFFDALRDARLVSAQTLHELTRPQIEARPGQHYGLGFGVVRWEQHEGFGHNGGAPGLNAEAMVFPAADVTIVVLANGDPPAASQQLASLRREALSGSLCRAPG
ncbi:serine hydrolase domain-containing protein [Roseateles sp. P5_E7]